MKEEIQTRLKEINLHPLPARAVRLLEQAVEARISSVVQTEVTPRNVAKIMAKLAGEMNAEAKKQGQSEAR